MQRMMSLALALSLSACASNVTVFRDADVIPMTSREVLHHQSVVVKGARIVSVGDAASTQVPFRAHVIDANGMTLMPGMMDAHAHLPVADEPGLPMDEYLFFEMARGVTTVRAMRGDAQQLALAHRIDRGEVEGPTLLVSCPPIGDHLSAADARRLFPAYKRDGYAFVKYLGGTTVAEYDDLTAIAKENDLRVMGHVTKDVGLAHAVAAGQCDVEHLSPIVREFHDDPAKLDAAIAAMAANHVAHTPDIVWYLVQFGQRTLDELEKVEGLEYVPEKLHREWHDSIAKNADPAKQEKWKGEIAAYLPLLKKMNDAGVPLLVSAADGEYIVPGFSMADEMRVFASAGIEPIDILRAATRNGAEAAGQHDWGTIGPGQRADLVLLAASPLDDISNVGKVEGVMVRGRWMPKGEIDARLAKLRATKAR